VERERKEVTSQPCCWSYISHISARVTTGKFTFSFERLVYHASVFTPRALSLARFTLLTNGPGCRALPAWYLSRGCFSTYNRAYNFLRAKITENGALISTVRGLSHFYAPRIGATRHERRTNNGARPQKSAFGLSFRTCARGKIYTAKVKTCAGRS